MSRSKPKKKRRARVVPPMAQSPLTVPPDDAACAALAAIESAVNVLGKRAQGVLLVIHWADGKGSVVAGVPDHVDSGMDELGKIAAGAPTLVTDWALRAAEATSDERRKHAN